MLLIAAAVHPEGTQVSVHIGTPPSDDESEPSDEALITPVFDDEPLDREEDNHYTGAKLDSAAEGFFPVHGPEG